ncbi:DegT/DnrJ/EryC1/StrS family aminotransferase [Candidatus Auribacterota bacterium]
MKVLFNSPIKEYKKIERELKRAVGKVLDSGYYILGREVAEFERSFARYIGVKYAVGCASGTEAITLALMCLGKKGEVITQTNTCIPTISGILAAGCISRLVDIDPSHHVMDDKQVAKAINKKTVAIMPVHLYGRANITEGLIRAAKKKKVPIVEDCAQSHGARWHGKKLGSIGDLGCFSFYPTKNLGCYGDGGAVTTNNRKLYEKLIKLRNYGQNTRYCSDTIGINSRLDEMQAAVLNAKLKYLEKWNSKRRSLAKIYDRNIKADEVRKIFEPEKSTSVYHLYAVVCDDRDALRKYLDKKGIQTLMHYPVPMHLQKAYSYLGYGKGSFPVSEAVADKILSLPLYPELGETAVKYICSHINKFYGNGKNG